MNRDDAKISSSELEDIFGMGTPQTMSEIEEVSKEKKHDEKHEQSSIIVNSKMPEKDTLDDEKPHDLTAESKMVVQSKFAEMELAEKINKKPEQEKIVEQEQEEEKNSMIVQSKFAEMELAEKINSAESDKKVDSGEEIVKEQDKKTEPVEVDELATVVDDLEIKQEQSSADFENADYNSSYIISLVEISEETATAIKEELLKSVNEKAVENMMLKTLEKTALNFSVLKNANWDGDGKLRGDGTIDIERVLKNFKEVEGDGEEEIGSALKHLFFIRLKAVKTGAGEGKYAEVKEALLKKLHIISAGYKNDVVLFLRENVIVPAINMGDEDK